jgi:hypothetical protein
MDSPFEKLAKMVEANEEDKDILLRELIATRRAAEEDAAIAKEILQQMPKHKRRDNSSRRVLSKARVIGQELKMAWKKILDEEAKKKKEKG